MVLSPLQPSSGSVPCPRSRRRIRVIRSRMTRTFRMPLPGRGPISRCPRCSGTPRGVPSRSARVARGTQGQVRRLQRRPADWDRPIGKQALSARLPVGPQRARLHRALDRPGPGVSARFGKRTHGARTMGAHEIRKSVIVARRPAQLVRSGHEAYRRDLRELIKKHKGQWVAYSGERRLGITHTKSQAYQLASKEGWHIANSSCSGSLRRSRTTTGKISSRFEPGPARKPCMPKILRNLPFFETPNDGGCSKDILSRSRPIRSSSGSASPRVSKPNSIRARPSFPAILDTGFSPTTSRSGRTT